MKKFDNGKQLPTDPKWFSHNGHYDTDPTKVKKDGNGKNNWGNPGDELPDQGQYNLFEHSERRNPNHHAQEQLMKDKNNMIDDQLN